MTNRLNIIDNIPLLYCDVILLDVYVYIVANKMRITEPKRMKQEIFVKLYLNK